MAGLVTSQISHWQCSSDRQYTALATCPPLKGHAAGQGRYLYGEVFVVDPVSDDNFISAVS
jgi:hypothetical protein